MNDSSSKPGPSSVEPAHGKTLPQADASAHAQGPAAPPRPVPVHSPLRRILLTLLIPLSIGAVCFVAVALVVVSNVKTHPAYAVALAAVRADPGVGEALGGPLEPGFMAQGGVDSTDGVYEAMFSVAGPKGDAGVRVLAAPEGSTWRLVFLDVGANLADGRAKVITLANEELPRRFGVQRDALAEPLEPFTPPAGGQGEEPTPASPPAPPPG